MSQKDEGRMQKGEPQAGPDFIILTFFKFQSFWTSCGAGLDIIELISKPICEAAPDDLKICWLPRVLGYHDSPAFVWLEEFGKDCFCF